LPPPIDPPSTGDRGEEKNHFQSSSDKDEDQDEDGGDYGSSSSNSSISHDSAKRQERDRAQQDIFITKIEVLKWRTM